MIAAGNGGAQSLLSEIKTVALAGNLSRARALLADMLLQYPENLQGWNLAAALSADTRDWSSLKQLAERWTQCHPDCVEAWQNLSRALFEVSDFDNAITAYSRVLQISRGHPQHLISAAKIATAAQQFDLALDYLRNAQSQMPETFELLYALCRVHYLTGDLAKAEEYCRRTLVLNPHFPPAYTTLGQLLEGRLSMSEIQTLSGLLGRQDLHPEYRAVLGFTLGDALDRAGHYDQAFTAWSDANAINQAISAREGICYDAQLFEKDVLLLTLIFSEPLTVVGSDENADRVKPIFVVGMPRSCTTLLESILASHSGVQGAGELPALYDIYESLMHKARSEGVVAAREFIIQNAADWRRQYLASIPVARRAEWVVDKQPLNFRAIGLIRVLFPEAPIFYTRRDPIEVCFSIYRNCFSKNWPCAHRLEDIGHYYGVHQQLMARWLSLYPGNIHVVDHADLLLDHEQAIAKVLQFAGLSVEPACMMPHLTQRPIATFSAVQVRQPISGAYSGRSRAYKKHLAPLLSALQKSDVRVSENKS